MINPLISLIIPVYNVDKYLIKCIESVINQTYSNLEIILVNDGSTDNSPGICDDYVKKDSRIKVVHKVNGGLSDARNVGINTSKGEYLYFLDSDDYIDTQTIANLYITLTENNCEISVGKVIQFFENSTPTLVNHIDEILIYSGLTATQELYNFRNPNGLSFAIACNKLYKKQLFTGIKFPTGRINEDEFVNYRLFGRANKICFTSRALYFYLRREDSIMNSINGIKQLDKIKALRNREKYIEKLNEIQLLSDVRYHLFLTAVILIRTFKTEKDSERKLIKLIKNLSFKIAIQLFFSSISYKRKINILSKMLLISFNSNNN